MNLAWLVVNNSGTLPSAQLGEDPHPEAGGNLEQDQIGLGPQDEVDNMIFFQTWPSKNCAKVEVTNWSFGFLVWSGRER